MNLSRRSFLAAVMGAIGAPVVVPKLVDLSPLEWKFGTFDDYVIHHFTVWDSVEVMPGEVLKARLLPPPIPKHCLITNMSVSFNADAPYHSLLSVVQGCEVVMKDGDPDVIRAPLPVMPQAFEPGSQFPQPYVPQSADFGIYLHSHDKPVRSVDPVTVTVALQGLVRLPREQQRRGALISQAV